ncbi:MAG: hypothetical protein KAH86_05530 [Methanosarcinales archaeon]|nr:hypothetical protein [Methanosarcinales archaeon]
MNINVLKVAVLVIALLTMLSVSGCLGGDEDVASEYADTTSIGTKDTPDDAIAEIIEPPRDPTIFDSDLIIFMDEAVHTYDTETGAWVGYSAPIGLSTEYDGRILATFTKRTIYHLYENNNTWVPKNESVNLTWSFALSLPTGGTIGGTGTSERMYVSKHNATDGIKNDMPLIGSNVVEYDGKTVWYNTEGTAMYSAVKSGQSYPLLS